MSERLTSSQRSQRARKAANSSWARTPDPAARTAAARRSFLDRFEREVDPDGSLRPDERQRRAASARRAYFVGMALKSSRRRSRKASGGSPGDAESKQEHLE